MSKSDRPSRKALIAEIDSLTKKNRELAEAVRGIYNNAANLVADYERTRAYAVKLVSDPTFYAEAVLAFNDKSLACPCPSCEADREEENSSTDHPDQQ